MTTCEGVARWEQGSPPAQRALQVKKFVTISNFMWYMFMKVVVLNLLIVGEL